MKPIFIPTKGRFNNCKTAELLGSISNMWLVVEPQELEKYKANYSDFNYIELPENDKGITYVRNFILNFSNKMGYDWFWMLDDDISGIFRREGTKLIRDNNALYTAENLIGNNTGQISLEYRQFAWSATKEFVLNSYNDVCVCINVQVAKKNDIKYREYLTLKEDRDFTMQIIKAGYDVKRTTLSAFTAPKNGSNEGGLKCVYDTSGRELEASKRMVEIWGENICRLKTKPDGRKDVKIMWKEINSNQQSLF
jgi:hypothetical protein